ncbi:ABC transporter permease [Cryptosporangium aurantiacum]|uniref:ABC-type nitrate/sulfonate/bicarbonate transport system, permease component n=1 Tax=Cryptosporangium aurantiacum TaxID=134849 RepID=A0A1M7RIG5_9ACTN|nr:ABC transporter permease [Cryptosporangium aurantiacum]SHN45868.1 ABC-type nitrate/sulfonate/bicarbonate transport system, permease component [Cryptosporangium aurantiacum]
MRLVLKPVRWFLLPAALIGIWWAASVGGQNFFLPTPDAVARAFGPTWTPATLRADVLPSVVRLLTGFLLAGVIGVAVGTAIGLSPRLRAYTEPVLEFLRAVPPPVLIPVVMLFAGIDNTMKITVIVFGCVWPVLLNTIEGVRAVDPVLGEVCRSYRIGGLTRLRTLVLRGASPQIMTGLRQALAIAIILMVISEMFAASSGLGFTIVQFQRSYAIPEMWTGIILLGLLGVLLAGLFGLAERVILRWYFGLRRSARDGGN